MVKGKNGEKKIKLSSGERMESSLGPGFVKIFISIDRNLDKRMRSARHAIESDKYNAACVEILRLGVERIENDPEVVKELKKKFIGED